MTRHFVKRNNTDYADALIKEAQGLRTIQHLLDTLNITDIKTPNIIRVSETELVLEHIESVSPSREQVQQLARSLAIFHEGSRHSSYGLDYDNYIGLNPQINTPSSSWGVFFVQQRLNKQIDMIRNESIQSDFRKTLEQTKPHLIRYLDLHCKKTSLCHGDLWYGNVMFSKNQCWLIDPAIYWGDREADIAMTEMFAGFTSIFYDTYFSEHDRSREYARKKIIYNLYHYLNHYNLFGASYLASCKSAIDTLKNI
jgi:fructosamine-3-kinase